MTSKPVNKKTLPKWVPYIAVLLVLYMGSLLLPYTLPGYGLKLAIFVAGFQLIAIILVLTLMIILVFKNKREALPVLAVLLTMYIGSLFAPLISPFTKFPLYVVKCGSWPIVASNFSGSYRVPSNTSFYQVDVFTDHYFCTETEAKAAGFHRYP